MILNPFISRIGEYGRDFFAWPNVKRGLVGGFPEWYKEELVKLQFKESE